MEELNAQLLALSKDDFEKEKERNTDNLKRLYVKLHRLEVDMDEIDKETQFYEKLKEDEEEITENVLYHEEINALNFILEEIEMQNVDLENKCLSVPSTKNTTMIKDIIDEFNSKCIEEKNKNKKIGLYIKKEFYNSKNEEINKLKSTMKKLNQEIGEELGKVNELEEYEKKLLQNISVLQRLYRKEEKAN